MREPQPVVLPGGGPAGRGSRSGWERRSFLAPLLALFHSGCLAEKEAGVRGGWWGPTANVDAPAPLSSVLLLGLHGYRRND